MYYFTFSPTGQLYESGWVRIQADNLEEAQQKFIQRYGDKAWKGPKVAGILNYAFAYSEEHFQSTIMANHGNFGKFEHEFIS